ncbi:hypothetical protein FA13DRAFT_1527585 [Coprinellus micaceus]|uniref:Uncharacterized protein n=1 Tax=Coprinellus micaceus TaxID=71717 RepID=A0A4Y7SJD1_COPMI|nr:hypothetical protein FA13DRAFT_1527585 [Coprinellus micaceus]
MTVPQDFWEELACLPTLEVVHMKWCWMWIVQPFLQAMQMSMTETDPQVLAHARMSNVKHPFPSLKAVILESCEAVFTDLRRGPGRRSRLPSSCLLGHRSPMLGLSGPNAPVPSVHRLPAGVLARLRGSASN